MQDNVVAERLDAVVSRLSERAVDGYYNPYQLFKWPDSIPEDAPWMSEELLSCYGTAIWKELSADERIRLSHWEAVNFYGLNVHLIRDLMLEVLRRIHTSRYPSVSEFFHHFLGEENEHMWFFAQFCNRYGHKLYEDKRLPFEATEWSDPNVRDLVVFCRILVAEEIVDFLNTWMSKDGNLPPIVRQINAIHHQDESRHIGFGRQMVTTLWAAASDAIDDAQREALQSYLGRYVLFTLHALYNPAVYRDAGVPDPYGMRSRLLADPERSAFHYRVTAKVSDFLDRINLVPRDSLQL
jgi:P-aminobenzoate N-oxygenase AurF